MKKSICVICLLIGVITAQAQDEKKQFIHKGLLRAMATISPGIMLKENMANIYLHGNLEYYITENISIRGDAFYSVNSTRLEFNHSIFSGASYHFKTKNHFDPYVAFQPGVAISRNEWAMDVPSVNNINYSLQSNSAINPLISSTIGFNYYFQKWFHLFAEGRYLYGKHIAGGGVTSLSELRFSFGLGFNLSVFRPKTTSSISK